MNIFRKEEGEHGVFRNEDVFRPEFQPEHVLERDAETKEMVHSLKPVGERRRPTNMVLYGPPGTGKTCCTRFVLGELQEYTRRALPVYVNCWRHSSRFAILSKIAEKFDVVMPRRGIGTEELMARLVEFVRKSEMVPIIVLDEADAVVGEEEKIFYDLLRMGETDGLTFVLIAITNREDLLAKLDRRIRSSLMQGSIEFKRYSPAQLKKILGERAKAGFVPGACDAEVVGACAGFAAKNGGDARLGITLLWLAGREAEKAGKGSVGIEDVEAAKGKVAAQLGERRDGLLNETDREIMALLRKGEKRSGEIYEALGGNERTVRMHLGKLESMRLIESEYLNSKAGRSRVFRLCGERKE